jgi:formate hydrogenlyase subunit 3/multisubunit Na+/H+ antiporter MnhD subunit
MALRQHDLKLMLAWSTVVTLGTLVMFLGSGLDIAVKAALTFVIVHALYKCALFLVVGNIDHGTGTRDADRLGGLWRPMPVSAAIAALAALSMAGFPPFLGSIGKELRYEGALAIAREPFLFASAAVAANVAAVSVALTLVLTPFFARPVQPLRGAHEGRPAMLAGPVVLALAGLVLGIDPDLVFVRVIGPAAAAVLGRGEPVIVALHQGWGLPLILSVATIAAGILLYLARRLVRRLLAALARRLPLSGERGFGAVLSGLKRLAAWQTNLVQSGSPTRYMALTDPSQLGFVAALLLVAFGIKAGAFPLFAWLPASYHTPPVAVSAIFAALLTKVVGALAAAAQDEVRRILAVHIVSQIGYLLLGLALLTPLALAGAAYHLVHNMLVKTALFLLAGIAARRGGGSFQLARLGGLWRRDPWLSLLFLLAALSLAGVPPLSGFWGKLVLVRAGIEAEAYLAVAVALATGLLTMFSMSKIWNEAFWKEPPPGVALAPLPPASGTALTAPVLLLVALALAMGLAPAPFMALAERAAAELLDPTTYVAAVLGSQPSPLPPGGPSP